MRVEMAVLEGTRFTPVKDLGAGAMGRVTLVRDGISGDLVALKRLHEAIAQQGGARLRREFRSLERIQHECVVKVLGYGDEDGIPFLVMEYVRGADLNDVIVGRPSIEALIRVFIDVAGALGAVHAAGIIHRDLKPENIRVTPEGRAKLMDFGLAKSLDGTVALTRAGAVVGTVLYMSPEQCRGALLDYRADLYSLGALMYWAFAGRAPFIGEGLAQVVMQHLQTPPTPPRVFNAALPAGLERLILGLLSKNPGDRPASAAAVTAELVRTLTEPMDAIRLPADSQPRADALLLAGLIGRDAELGMLLPLLEQPDPICGVYAVTGDVGIGKSRLLRALGEEARGRDATKFAFGEAIPDDPTPFGAVSRLIHGLSKAHRNLLDGLPEATRNELSRIAPSAFEGAAPPGVIAPLEGTAPLEVTAPLNGNLPPEVARLRLFEAFTELLERASEVTVLVIENLHWADDSTLALLAHATRAATAPRLILSYRLEDLAAGQTTPKGITRPRVTVNLSALPDEAMRELLGAWLDGDIDPALQNELVAQASGNPWVLEERLKAMLESGAVFKRGGVYEWNHSVMTLPDGLNDLLSHRIMSLPMAALEFARAASVLGKVWLYADVVALLGWNDDNALDALEALTRARLTQEVAGTGGEGFRFTHPLYSEMLLDGLMSLKRRRLHSKAAKLLETRAAPLELAYHHYFAQEYAASLLRGLEAGRAAQITFAYPQAERAYRLALDASAKLGRDLLETLRCKHHLAEVLSHTGRNEDALLLWQEVLHTAPQIDGSARLAGETRVKLARVQRFLGSVTASRSLLSELSIDDPFFEELKLEQSLASTELEDWNEARRYGLEALTASKSSGNIGGQVRALAALSSLSAATSQPRRAAWLAQVAVNIAERSEDAFLKTEAWNELGRRYYDAQNQLEAMQSWERAAQYALTTGDLRSRAGLEINIAAKLMSDFDYESAAARLREARKIAARAGLHPYEQAALYNLGHCEYALSHLEIAREAFHDVKPSDDARLWETRITLELGDGFVHELPTVDPSPFSKLLEVQWALSFGDYAKAWALTEPINAEYPWAWAVGRAHAGWRLGRNTRLILETLRALATMEEHLEIEQHTAQRQVAFMKRALLDQRTPETKLELQTLAQTFRSSSLGLLARDVLLSLSQT